MHKKIDFFVKIINLFLPEKIKSIYLLGSYAQDYTIETSDIDGVIVLENSCSKEDIEKLNTFIEYLYEISDIELDFEGIKEEDLIETKYEYQKTYNILIKNNSKLIYGEDISNKIPSLDINSYISLSMNRPTFFILRLRESEKLKYPLNFPNEKDFYFGYCKENLLYQGENILNTKTLVVTIGWIATALIAYKTSNFVYNKNELVEKYKLYLNDEWASFIEDLFSLCRDKYKYLMPTDENDKNKLRDLCIKSLDFENYFLEQYKSFALENSDKNSIEINQTLSKIEFI